MMPLQDLYVETQLNEQIGTYLAQEITYADLRTKCLSNAAISSIVTPIVERLNAAAEHDKAQRKDSLTRDAHKEQTTEDAKELKSDATQLRDIKEKERKLESSLTDYERELDRPQGQLYQMDKIDLPRIQQQLQECLNQIHDLTLEIERQSNPQLHVVVDHPTPHIRTEHHASHHHGRRHTTTNHDVNRLTAELEKLKAGADILTNMRNQKIHDIQSTQRKISSIRQKISTSTAELEALKRELTLLTERKDARDERTRNGTLSSGYAKRLRENIQDNNRQIDILCARMKTETKVHCHSAFLTQLNIQLNGLRLELNEKRALTQLIQSMQEHKQDLTALQRQQSILETNKNALHALEQQHASNKVRSPALVSEHADLLHANDVLGAQLRVTQRQQEAFEAQRNAYAQYALITTIVAGLSAISGYFLIQNGVIAVAPIVPMIMAGVVGAALVTLLGIAGVAGIRALLRQSEATAQDNTLTANTNRMAAIRVELLSLEASTPELVAKIKTSQRCVAEQEMNVAFAAGKAAASFASAQEITPETAEQRTISSNPHILFRAPLVPSAPPAPPAPPTPLTDERPDAQDTHPR